MWSFEWIKAVLLLTSLSGFSSKKFLNSERRGPTFVQEPPFREEFLNSSGAVVPCSAKGRPMPTIRWLLEDETPALDLPGLRHSRPDGALLFRPFSTDRYRPDVHATAYRCLASNSMGKILSRQVHVRAMTPQRYVVEMHDEFVLKGNTAVLRCHLPGFVRDQVYVEAWIKNPSEKVDAEAKHGRYSMFPTGELHVRNVLQSDGLSSYTCRTKHRLTGKVISSKNPGRIIVTEPYGQVPPRITHIASRVVARIGESVQLPCAGQAFPLPTYTWLRREDDGPLTPLRLGSRKELLGGSLLFKKTEIRDSGRYICVLTSGNSQDKGETELIITAPLHASIFPLEQVADVGGRVSFNCTVTGHPISRPLRWSKDASLLSTEVSGQERLRITEEGHRLTIESVKRDDRGAYQCFAYSDHDSVQATAQLTIGDNPPEFLETFAKETILDPQSPVSLKCVASGIPLPQITWTLDGLVVPEDQSFRSGDYVTIENTVVSYVNVSRVGVRHSGEFACTAANDAGTRTHSGWLRVPGPPFIRPMPNRTVVAGETFKIRCPAGGHPVHKISWERGGVRLPDNHRQTVYPNGTLVVKLVERPTDEGKYTCTARNKEGDTDSGSFHVTVRVRPVIELFGPPAAVRIGQRLSISCTMVQGDPPMTIKWLRDGQMLTSSDTSLRIHDLADYSSTLLFEALKPEQRGNYTCIATNEAGSQSHSAAMVIHVPPRWKTEPTDVEVIKGKSVVIDCAAEGFPPLRLTWRKAEGQVPESYKAISSSSHLHVFENGSLAILDASEADAGFYLCQASNGIGSGLSKIIKLSVHVAAQFTAKFHAEITKKGDDAKLTCQAFGERPLTLTWSKDRQPLEVQSQDRYKLIETVFNNGTLSELIIQSVLRGDSALFTCYASNAYGKDEMNIQLIIQEKPDTPQDLRASRITSRSVQMSWSPPYSGNSRLLKYLLRYEETSQSKMLTIPSTKSRRDVENDVNSRTVSEDGSGYVLSIPASEVSWTISSLNPKTEFAFRISAVNALGESDPSVPVYVATEEEAPGGPPLSVKTFSLSSSSVKVTWETPETNLQFGQIKGYYIGYRIKGSKDQYVYKTVDRNIELEGESVLSNLIRDTEYQVRVQAYNAKGAGPPSEDVDAHTLKEDPPRPPSLEVTGVTGSAISVTWKKDPSDRNPINGYIIHYKREYGSWKEVELDVEMDNYELSGLQCGSRYDLYITPHNTIGTGEGSNILSAKTNGRAPSAPEKESLLSVNSTSATLDLSSWGSNGCPITHFEIQYKQQRHQQWILFADRISPNRKSLILANLAPSTYYQLRVTAHNEAGPTEAEYLLVTAPELRRGVGLQDAVLVSGGEALPFYLELEVILPVSLSLVVVVAVLVLVCLIVRKRNPSSDTTTRSAAASTTYASSRKSHTESVHLCEMEKSAYQRPNSRAADPIYYPTPYATTHIAQQEAAERESARRKAYEAAVERELQEEPQYATVKRTPRPPKSDVHIYHYPVHIPPELLDELQGTSSSSSSSRWGDPAGGGGGRFERMDGVSGGYLGRRSSRITS